MLCFILFIMMRTINYSYMVNVAMRACIKISIITSMLRGQKLFSGSLSYDYM